MFTHLFDLFISGVGTMPGLMVYVAVALWIGAENVGIPLPLELMALFSGSLIAFGELSFGFVLGTVVAASLAFAALAYVIGRRTGTSGVLRVGRFVGLTQKRIDHIDSWLRQRGALGVVLARIIPGIRLFSSYVMGIADISPTTFAVGTLIGSACYISIWLILGTLLGSNYRAPLHYLDQLGLYGLALIVLALAAAFVIHQVWGRRNLHHLATQYALQASSSAAVNVSSQAGAAALPPSQASALLPPATETPQTSPASATTSREVRTAPLSGARASELRALRQAMRAAAARLWPTWLARTLFGAWIVALLLFVALASAAHQSAAFPIDLSLSQQLRPLSTMPLGLPLTFLGDLQGPMGAAVAYVVLLGVLVIIRFFREALCLAISGLGAETSNVVVNGIVARPRPPGDITHTLANLGAYSFPSGHSANCVGLYGFLFYLSALAISAPSTRPRWRPWLIAIQVVCAIFILDVGVSRVIEGQHWPSDVAGGYLLGGLFLLIGIALYHALAERDAQVAPHGVLPHVTDWVQPAWAPISATTTRALRDVDTVDRRIAGDVGLRGPDLQAQFRTPWPSWTITLVSAAWVELATVALIISLFAHRYATFPIDGSLAASVQQLRGTPWAALIYPAGDLQWYLPTAIAYALIFGALLGLRLYLAAIFVALSSFGTDIINVVINAVVARPRPHGVSISTLTGGRLGSASFPSGHVAHTIGLYGFVFFLCILAMRAQPRLKPWLFAIQAVCLYFIFFVGASRVLEGQHWPSDVAGGYLVGILVLALVIVLYHLTAMRGNARHDALAVETQQRKEASAARGRLIKAGLAASHDTNPSADKAQSGVP